MLASKLLHSVSLNDSFIMLDAKLLKPLSCVQTTTALQAVNIIGTFEKRAPDYETNETYATESTEQKN